jgi:hypothetical protein
MSARLTNPSDGYYLNAEKSKGRAEFDRFFKPNTTEQMRETFGKNPIVVNNEQRVKETMNILNDDIAPMLDRRRRMRGLQSGVDLVRSANESYLKEMNKYTPRDAGIASQFRQGEEVQREGRTKLDLAGAENARKKAIGDVLNSDIGGAT